MVCAQDLAQPLESSLRGSSVESLQLLANGNETAHPLESDIDVLAVVHRLTHVDKISLIKSRFGQHGLDFRWIAERKGIEPLHRNDWLQLIWCKAPLNRSRPLVRCMSLPDHHDQTTAGDECTTDVAKRSERI